MKDESKMIAFAKHCMITLLSTKDANGMSEITSYDLYRIDQVLNTFKETKNETTNSQE